MILYNKMSELKVKFVQISNDKVNIRGVTEPIEDGDDPVHGFIENKLYAVGNFLLVNSSRIIIGHEYRTI